LLPHQIEQPCSLNVGGRGTCKPPFFRISSLLSLI
jgi:hypothetical protein